VFKILCLDGGGIRGAFAAGVLAAIEKDTGKRIIDHFDLIAGTSTGGILAIGLGLGMSATELENFYEERGSAIFPNTFLPIRFSRKVMQLVKPKHSGSRLRRELQSVFKKRKFGESSVPLVIPAYDATSGRIFVFKTPHHERFRFDYDAFAFEIAQATASAPTYFEASMLPAHKNNLYIDGGVWANSPLLVAITEATSFFGIESSEISILSIGTTSVPFNLEPRVKSGFMGWGPGIIELFMNAQQEHAVAFTSLLLGNRFHRINFTAERGQFALDDARDRKIKQLIAIGRAEAVKKKNVDVIQADFFDQVKTSNYEPFYDIDP